MDKVLIGEEIRRRRLAKGWTLQRVAQMLNTSPSQISEYERNLRTPNVYIANDISVCLGCTLDELLGRQDNTVSQIADLLEELMVNGVYSIYIDTEIAQEIITAVRDIERRH